MRTDGMEGRLVFMYSAQLVEAFAQFRRLSGRCRGLAVTTPALAT